MEKFFKCFYEYRNFDKSIYRRVPGLKNRMEEELMTMHGIYADMCNNGVIDQLNKEFRNLNPNYFEEHNGF